MPSSFERLKTQQEDINIYCFTFFSKASQDVCRWHGNVDKKATTKIEESKQTSKVVLDDSNVKIDNPLLIENIIDTESDGELIEEKVKLEVNEDNKNESIKSDKNKQ